MYFTFEKVNHAFYEFCRIFLDEEGLIRTESRNGPVLRFPHPVVITYTNPLQRVLFNRVRDCNPFFHLYEAMWMLNGNNDVASLAYYNKKIADYSDNGVTFHGAYGYRWKNYFGYDQLDFIIDELTSNPSSRRCVLQMWDGGRTNPEFDSPPFLPEPVDCTGDLYVATHGGKDVPCNLCAVFEIIDGKLHMTVYNRSNDAIWGSLGANYVHFSFLLEYVANCVGVPVGNYNQISNNLHLYTEVHTKEMLESCLEEPITGIGNNEFTPLVDTPHRFNLEVKKLVEANNQAVIDGMEYKEPFLANVVQPALNAFHFHKIRMYETALNSVSKIQSADWREACYAWIEKRQANFLSRTDSNPYLARRSSEETGIE